MQETEGLIPGLGRYPGVGNGSTLQYSCLEDSMDREAWQVTVHSCTDKSLSHFSCVQLFVTLWTVTHQAPLSMGFSMQEYWSGLPCSPPRDLPDPAIKATLLIPPELSGR